METTEGLVRTFPYVLHLAAQIARLGITRIEVEDYSFPVADRSLPHSIRYVRQIISVAKSNAHRGGITAIHGRE